MSSHPRTRLGRGKGFLILSRIKSGFEPDVECLCFGPDCFYIMFKVHAHLDATEKQRTCELCGSTKTTRWRRAGMAHVEMELLFRCGEASRKTQYYLASCQGGLSMESLVCQKCWSLMLYNRQTYFERIKNAEVRGAAC